MSTESSSLQEDLKDCLAQQLCEIDLLQAMYPNPGDIILSDKNIDEIKNYIDSKSGYVPNNLDFVINLTVNDLKLELIINLPLSYPNEEPDIYIRCNQLNRQQETFLNTELSEFLKNNHVGEVSLYTAITWLQDNIDTVVTQQAVSSKPSNDSDDIEEYFSRYWIYSHHIYNKKKREEIQKLAKELNLTGFCLPGKPGVICIEGNKGACMEWWKVIKGMCWKKIAVRNVEIFDLKDQPNQRTFPNFEELHFNNPTNSKHANMSQFSKYITDHGFTKIFSDFFGLNE